MKKITMPFTEEKAKGLVVGDKVLITGTIYTARDAAHKRLIEQLNRGEELPFDIENAIIYYVGPTPAKEGEIIGSAGPTTSYRMDPYTKPLLEMGLKGMIGKGRRSDDIKDSVKSHGAVYFAAVGGAAALISNCITHSKVIAYEDLGTEAIRRLEVKEFPVIVVVDSKGNDLYLEGREKYREINMD